MPESNYEKQLEELDKEYERQRLAARKEYLDKKIPIIEAQIQIIERNKKEAKSHNERIADIRRKQENELKGETHSTLETYNRYLEDHRGNHRNSEQDYDNDYLVPVTIIGKDGKEQEFIPISREEIAKLDREKDQLKEEITKLENERREIVSQTNRAKAQSIREKYNREGLLDEAYKFFTYLDTSTTKGYDVSELTKDEVIDLYQQIYKNRKEKGYKNIWDKTMERMMKGDREVVRPDRKEPEEKTSEPEVFGPPTSLKNPNNDTKPVTNSDEIKDEDTEELVEGKKSFKDKLNKFKNWARNHKKQLLIAGGAALTVVLTGSIVAGLIAAGGANMLSPELIAHTPVDNIFAGPINDIGVPDNTLVETTLTPQTDGPVNNELFTTSSNAANGIEGVQANPDAGPYYKADYNNPTTYEYAEVDPTKLTLEELNKLKEAGYTVPAYTNDPSMIGQGGEAIAQQGKISGFGRSV